MSIRRYKLTVAYEGTGFRGWQKQVPPDGPPLRTVQGVLEEAIGRTLGQPIRIIGASRTDSGVHALGQTAQFDAATPIPVERLARAINSRLPDDVEVRHAAVASEQFDAISGALDKQYRYRLWTSWHRPLHLRRLVYHCWTPLDVAAMRDAAARLEGRHDFGAFAAAGHQRTSTIRTVHGCTVETHGEDDPLTGQQVHVVISGDGFLYNMVRIVVGTLVEIGRGRWGSDYIDQLLTDPRRELAGPTLPPQGLCLEWVKYAAGSVLYDREPAEAE